MLLITQVMCVANVQLPQVVASLLQPGKLLQVVASTKHHRHPTQATGFIAGLLDG